MSTPNPLQGAFEVWRQSLEEGTRAWVQALGQAAPEAPSSAPPFDLTQLWRPILGQGMDLWQKAAAQGALTPDFMAQWKRFMEQWIEAWSKALGQAMATEGFAQALGRYLDQLLAVQAPVKKALEQSTDTALKALGLPSRGQVVSVAAQVVGLEERLEGLEDRLDELKALIRDALRVSAGHDDAGAAGARHTAKSPGKPARSPAGAPGRSQEGA